MRVYEAETFSEVYRNVLSDLMKSPDYRNSPRGMKCNELLNVSMTIKNPIESLYFNERRPTQYKYVAGEYIWYFMGDRHVDFIEKYSKFWRNLTDKDGNLNSAYGYLLFRRKNEHDISQWEWAYRSLVEDEDTRQSILHFNTPDHQFFGNKDFVCTLGGTFHIRKEADDTKRLHFTVYMRSNDAILGLATDVAFFTVLHRQMHKLLKENKYPDLKLGSYTHIDNSLHIYERNFKLVDEMLEHKFYSDAQPKMGINFVDEHGIPDWRIRNMYNCILLDESTCKHVGDDPFFDWVGTFAMPKIKQSVITDIK